MLSVLFLLLWSVFTYKNRHSYYVGQKYFLMNSKTVTNPELPYPHSKQWTQRILGQFFFFSRRLIFLCFVLFCGWRIESGLYTVEVRVSIYWLKIGWLTKNVLWCKRFARSDGRVAENGELRALWDDTTDQKKYRHVSRGQDMSLI